MEQGITCQELNELRRAAAEKRLQLAEERFNKLDVEFDLIMDDPEASDDLKRSAQRRRAGAVRALVRAEDNLMMTIKAWG